MRRLVSYAIAAVLTLSGCATSLWPSAQGPEQTRHAQEGKVGAGQGTPDPKRSSTAPVVMVLGDSYVVGIEDTPPEATYVAHAARKLGWQIIIAGHQGTGFVTQGKDGKAFPALYQEQLAWRPAPDMVMVSGGRNDWPHDSWLVSTAARSLFTQILQRWPDTELVLTGPIWVGEPSPAILQVRDALKGVADELHVPFIDPLREQWITGNISMRKRTGTARHYIRRDGIHPNMAGNRYLGQLLVNDLHRLGLDRPLPPASTGTSPP